MNKLKNVFLTRQKGKIEDNRRPQQFVKRQSAIHSPALPLPQPIPEINLAELSEMEKPAYESWWKDLDPFDLKKINNQTILKFLNGCSLEDTKLEQILTLFETAGDGLNKLQFFAMLRLIAHAQNGRKISPALVYLGAPIPHFHTNAIDALIKSPETPDQLLKKDNRKSWWGNEKQQESDISRRTSYMGPFTAHTPIPTTPFENTTEYFYSNQLTSPLYQSPAPPPPPINPNWVPEMRASLTTSLTTPVTPIASVTPNVSQHGRSRSAGTASDFIQFNNNPYQTPSEELTTSKSSLSLHEFSHNNGQSLLLTQKFVYQSPSTRHQELSQNANNPFQLESSPFDDHNSSSDTEQEEEPEEIQNNKPNTLCIAPPPVPHQSTKPAFPKYKRTEIFVDIL